MIVKELQKQIGEIYLGRKNIITDELFIMENINIYCQMEAAEFEGLLYTILSEELFKNQIICMTEEKYYYTISDYVSQNFGVRIRETMGKCGNGSMCRTFYKIGF